MKICCALAATTLALVALPASAQEATPFAGAHVGAEAGWGRVTGDESAGDGFVYGATAGYDLPAGKLRFGPELEFADSTQETCHPYAAGGPAARRCARADRDLYAGVRLGYVVTPSLMLYGKVGYTNGRFSDKYESFVAGAPPKADTADDHNGVRVGAGAEYAVSKRFYLSAEYRYSGYGEGFHRNQVMSGVGFRF